MKALLHRNQNTVTAIIAALVILSGIAAFLCSLSANQLELLIRY